MVFYSILQSQTKVYLCWLVLPRSLHKVGASLRYIPPILPNTTINRLKQANFGVLEIDKKLYNRIAAEREMTGHQLYRL